MVGGAVATVPLVGGFALLAAQFSHATQAVSFGTPTVGKLDPLNVRSLVVDRHGTTIAVLRSEQNRSPVSFEKIPKNLINAVLAVEDAEFFRHRGVNLRATARALFADVEAGGAAQGGSTITQQLVKISLLSSAQKFDRKVREARLALQIERQYTKTEILERYLNAIYFGEGAYGVQAAAEQYFGVSVDKVTIGQSAFLAGMIRNPVGYDPVRFRERSRARRATVLNRMVVEKYITAKQAETLKLAPMPRPSDRLQKPNSYFVEEVTQRLLDDRRLGDTPRDRYNAVFNGGLSIRTTFDPVAQRYAEQAVHDVIPVDATQFTAAVASVDVATGAVRALVGGRGFDTDKYNLATQGTRQPGSSWKPFILVAALESGISPNSNVSGIEPCPIPNPGGTPDPYRPQNAEAKTGKVATILDQIVVSSNCAYARLAYIVGYDKVAAVAHKLGISTKIDQVPAMALGVEEVHPIDMAAAYATLAAEGRHRTPYLIEEVRDRDGKVLIKADQNGEQVVDREIARIATSALQRVVQRGTGTRAALTDRQTAGKTGTTNNFEDAWFVGFTPQLATAVWMGAPEAKVSMRDVGGVRVFGGSYPADIWKNYMEHVLRFEPAIDFNAPDETQYAKGECLAVSVEKSLLAKKSHATGRGFGIGTGTPPFGAVAPGPGVPRVVSKAPSKGRTCADYFGATPAKKKIKPTKAAITVNSAPGDTVPRVDVAAPVPAPEPTPSPETVAPPVVNVAPPDPVPTGAGSG